MYVVIIINHSFLYSHLQWAIDWKLDFSSILAALSFEPLVYIGLIKDRVQKNLSHGKGRSTDAANCYYFAQFFYY